MRISKIAFNATDVETLYDHINKAISDLELNFVGKAKIEMRRAKKVMERIRPHLKNRGIR